MGVGPAFAHAAMHAVGPALHSVTKPISVVTSNAVPMEFPPTSELIHFHTRGLLLDSFLHDAAKNQGALVDPTGSVGEEIRLSTECWQAAWESAKEIATFEQLVEIVNRQLAGDDVMIARLGRLGYYDTDVKKEMTNLRYDIPGPADLVRFSVRHVWEPDLVADIGYDEEFPGAIIDVWHAMKGLDYKLFTGPFADQVASALGGEGANFAIANNYAERGIPEPTWARAYWWSHWVLPSPGQGYEMMFRLRPGRDPKYDPPEAKGLEFTFDDLKLLLRANDYPPKYRPLLSAIAHRMPGVRFIRDFRKQGVYDFRAVLEWALRWGYSEQDALDIASDIEASVTGAEQKKTSCKGCATCDQAFEVGVLSRDELQQCYTDYGMPPEEAAKNAGLADLKLAVKRGREIVGNVRKRFLRGTLNAQQASQLLQQWGIKIDRVQNYLADWQLEFEAGRKELSAAQAVKYACQGIISVEDLVTRLTNLGYPPDDQNALISEAAVCASNLAAEQAAKVARADRQAKADAYTAARRARQSLVEAQRYLASHGTPKQLHDWFCAGTVGESEVWTRLNALGWPDVDITRFLGDCKSGRKPTIKSVGQAPVIPTLTPPSAEGQAIEQLP